MFYAAGAGFQSTAIEKALRVRCSRIHEDEKRRSYRYEDKSTPNARPRGQQYFKKKVSIKKYNGAHVAEGDPELEEETEEPGEMDDEDALDILFEDEGEGCEEEAEEDEEDSMETDELKEIFAAGWKAKQKTAEARKNRGWKVTNAEKGQGGTGGRAVDLKKKNSTCSSCGKMGHWKGDACCPNVLSGRDQPHVPAAKKVAQTVHFTFMTGADESPPPGTCARCHWPVPESQRFCGNCGQEQLMDARMNIHKRPKEEMEPEGKQVKEEQDLWDMVEPPPVPPPFTFEVPRETAMAAASMSQGSSSKGYGSIKLQTKEVMAALPSMSKEDKKRLQKALKDEEEEAAYAELRRIRACQKTYEEYCPDVRPCPQLKKEEEEIMRRLGSASSDRPSQGPLAPPKRDDTLPKPLRDQELKTFRKQLYDSQCKDGRLIPSKAAPTPSETQARCRHPFDSLRWSANQDGHYAKRRDCDLKSCLYWTVKHGALMVTLAHDRPPGVPWQAKVWVQEKEDATQLQTVREGGPKPSQICSRVSKTSTGEVLLQDDYTGEDVPFHKDITHQAVLITEFWYIEPHQVEVYNAVKKKLPPHLQTPGLAIADSGCRNAVGGRLWHEALQGALIKIKVPWTQVEEHEVYRFGAGAPVISTKAFIYPVLIHGAWDVVRISLVEGEATSCPGLIGPSELSRWKAVFRFSEKELELNGTSRPMILTWTRHPGIHLLDYEDTEADKARSFWESTEGRRRRKVLQENPQSLSFVAGAGEGSEGEEGSTEDEGPPVDTTDEEEEEDQPFREARKEQWLQQLQEDLGVKVIEAMSEDEEPEESEEAEESSSSHEVGVEVISSDSEEEEDKRDVAAQREEEVQEQLKGKKKNMNKQLRRKLGHHVHEIAMSYNQEQEKPASSAISETFVQRRVRPTRSRWSVLEVFTWTCAISLVAAARHWHFHEPVTLPRWDLMKSNDYAEALDYIDRVDPDLLVLAWPCGPWSPLQSLGNKTPLQRAQLQVKREENRTLLRFVRDATLAQRKRGGAVLGENPKPSLAWKEPLIEEAFAGTGDSICDMRTFGLRLLEERGRSARRKSQTIPGVERTIDRRSIRWNGRLHL